MDDVVYGIHTVANLIQSNQAREILVLKKQNTNSKITQIIENAKSNNIPVTFVDHVKKIPGCVKENSNHQNIFAIVACVFKTYSERDIKNLIPQDRNAFILVLDSVQDPHNFGACIRNAHSAGVDFIIVPQDNSSPINAVVKKVACGAVEHTKIAVVTNLVRAIEIIKERGVWIVGLTGEASDSLYDMNLNDSIAIVAGSEGKGMRRMTKTSCDFLAKLPMLGKISSLNVSVATGVALYEAVRQRQYLGKT